MSSKRRGRPADSSKRKAIGDEVLILTIQDEAAALKQLKEKESRLYTPTRKKIVKLNAAEKYKVTPRYVEKAAKEAKADWVQEIRERLDKGDATKDEDRIQESLKASRRCNTPDTVLLDSWLRDYCRRQKTNIALRREVQRNVMPVHLRQKKALDCALRELINFGWVTLVQQGRRKEIHFNPVLLKEILDRSNKEHWKAEEKKLKRLMMQKDGR